MSQATLPELTLKATSGQTVNLAELQGKKLVLYFYPKDSTPGCTVEAHDFAELHDEFLAAGAVVFGVSRDSLKSHENFKARQALPFELLSDADEVASNALGVLKLKTMCGRQSVGIERSTFVYAADGTLAREWRGVKVAGHVTEVLAFVQSL